MSGPLPYLDPELSLLWRAPNTLQVGLDPSRAVALAGASASLPAGLRSRHSAARSPEVARALTLLDAAALLTPEDPRHRWSMSWVQVVGRGLAAHEVVEGLRSAGVGRVTQDEEPSVPGPDLVVVIPDHGRGMAYGNALARAGCDHLWAHLRDGRFVVGPLVVPGGTSCLRCHDLHRTDADPAWPTLAVAWEAQEPGRPSPAAISLLASTAVRQALTWLRGARPASVDATLEEEPDGLVLRMAWPVHPSCGCGWSREHSDVSPTGQPSPRRAVDRPTSSGRRTPST